uniref:RxLR effector candidate protein n=1 Tax=Hyaloperonospora arabidopsidis (strain Emoy2) TaxID=559515 RepID=M4B3H3_HYAAE
MRRHLELALFLLTASIIAIIVYETTGGGKPKARVYDAPFLDAVDLEGPDRPRSLWSHTEFECLGWRATHECDPYGPRDESRDRKCDEPMPRTSGYCEVRNRTSGAILRVMLATCKSWQWYLVPLLSCNDAQQFTDFSILAAKYTHPPPIGQNVQLLEKNVKNDTDIEVDKRGVVMIAYPQAMAGLYAIVQTLRLLGCALTVEVWIDTREVQATHSVLKELQEHYNVLVRVIQDSNATKYHAKPYAIYHSRFESVLWLDSDNIPVRDPTYLFDTPEFVKHGAIFWPDFWRPAIDTPFNVHEQSALWTLLDMPFTDMFEQESGQLLVNRSRSQAALSKLMFYSSHMPRLLTDWQLVWGDKDLFRLAWLNTSTSFYMVQHLVALGGLYDADEDFFCGVSMIQRDPVGDIIFLHRNQAKLSGLRDQKPLILYLQKFTGGDGTAASFKWDLDKYRVQCKMHRLGQYVCFMLNPHTPDGSATPSLILSLEKTKYALIEQYAIGFSIEGRGLFSKEEEAEVAKVEADVQVTRDKEAASAFRERQQSKYYRSAMYGIVAVVALGLWLRWQWIQRCRKSRPRLETKNSSVPSSVEPSSSHVALAVDLASTEAFGSSSAVFSVTTHNSRRRNSSFQLDDEWQP